MATRHRLSSHFVVEEFDAARLVAFMSSRIEIREDGCWIWTASRSIGYGRVNIDGQTLWAHRVMYALVVGEVPEGLQIDHLCENRACCNPAHLEAVTHAENQRRAFLGRKRGPYKKHSPEANARKSEAMKASWARRKEVMPT